ncbi:glycosyltransferase [Lyngbya sp. CCAP 1446/10]|uniref:glycosyltransferase n=1 Tax=Microcoleaceae TaxID=1892252 RepID=UPI002237BA69|nr:glycosyltransferase [Lyngbya sp. CCAP 1446/10]MCW6053607.1 glycosyltransferase [Lyngbya sp. CCAP 1446/10]
MNSLLLISPYKGSGFNPILSGKGKGYAVKKGSEYAEADCICFMDGDLAYSLEHLERLLERLEKFDVVIGCTNLDLENFQNLTLLIKIACKIFNLISRLILNLSYRNMQVGLKGFKKNTGPRNI